MDLLKRSPLCFFSRVFCPGDGWTRRWSRHGVRALPSLHLCVHSIHERYRRMGRLRFHLPTSPMFIPASADRACFSSWVSRLLGGLSTSLHTACLLRNLGLWPSNPIPIPFVRIHSGNNPKIVFLCIYICYEFENISGIISICYARPPLNCKDQLCLHLQRRINSKRIIVWICICYAMHN